MELVIIIPHKDNIRKEYAMKFVMGFNVAVIHSLPQPPSFSNTAVRTMDQVMGAFMCAFGNHRWRPSGVSLLWMLLCIHYHEKTVFQEVVRC